MREEQTVSTISDDQTGGSRGTTSEAHLGVLSTTSRERSPLHVYLSRLSEGSRPTMSEALSTVARIASGGRLEAHQLPWHKLRYYRPMPEGVSPEKVWLFLKLGRESNKKNVPYLDKNNNPFSYWVPDSLLKILHEIDLGVGGTIITDRPGSPPPKEEYIVSSLPGNHDRLCRQRGDPPQTGSGSTAVPASL